MTDPDLLLHGLKARRVNERGVVDRRKTLHNEFRSFVEQRRGLLRGQGDVAKTQASQYALQRRLHDLEPLFLEWDSNGVQVLNEDIFGLVDDPHRYTDVRALDATAARANATFEQLIKEAESELATTEAQISDLEAPHVFKAAREEKGAGDSPELSAQVETKTIAAQPGDNAPVDSLAKWLDQALLERGWTPQKLEQKRGPCNKTTRRILGGERVTKSTLEKLAAALNVPESQIPKR
jgi:hypothetical protein